MMMPLQSQAQFEELLVQDSKANKGGAVVYFTASWCGACKRLDLNAIQESNKDVRWYKCDVDENKYTLGYCGLKSIPSFAFIKDGKFLGKFQSSNTEAVTELIQGSF